MSGLDTEVAVVGGGVVGCAVAHALSRRGVAVALVEAEPELGRGASAANSGILHTGFDSPPGELETRLILRAAELREQLLGELGVQSWRCGARLTPTGTEQRAAVARLAANARANGVQASLDPDGSLRVPGETVTDPLAFLLALAGAAHRGGAELITSATVRALARTGAVGSQGNGAVGIELADGRRLLARAAVNCAGLHADELARGAGDELTEVYPRKGEFLVFAAPARESLREILLPVPSELGKGVLVFPTLDRRAIIAGPTAREREDKRDWSVEEDAAAIIIERASAVYPPLAALTPIASYAGLRPAGRSANYAIERSQAAPGLVHVAAIRSTGLSASLAIAEHVTEMLAVDGWIAPGAPRPLPAMPAVTDVAAGAAAELWWERAARRSREAAGRAGAR